MNLTTPHRTPRATRPRVARVLLCVVACLSAPLTVSPHAAERDDEHLLISACAQFALRQLSETDAPALANNIGELSADESSGSGADYDDGFHVDSLVSPTAIHPDRSPVLLENCPELLAAIQAKALAASVPLPAAQLNLHDAANILKLDDIYARSNYTHSNDAGLARQAQRRSMDRAELSAIIQALPVTPLDVSWVDEVWRWFRNLFASEEGNAPDWLDFKISTELAEFVQNLLGIALVVAALVIVTNEVRLLRRRKQAPAEMLPRETISQPELQSIQNAPQAEQPSRWLALLLSRLEERGVIPTDPSRTHQAVKTLEVTEVDTTLNRLASTAELKVYGDVPPDNSEVAALVHASEKAMDAIATLHPESQRPHE